MDVRLVYFSSKGRRREVHLHKGIVSIGRGEICQLRIPAETVSRRHCEIEVMADSLVLTDLGSSNGTLVNGNRVSDDDVELKAGDKITVGPASFIVQIDGKPASIATPQAVDVDQEDVLTGSSVADDAFDALDEVPDLGVDVDEKEEEEDDEEIPKGPKIAQIKRSPEDSPKKGSGPRKP